MEKTINKPLDIVITTTQEGSMVFQIKEPQKINRNIYTELRKEFGVSDISSKVIYPDNNVIESQHYFVDSTTSII